MTRAQLLLLLLWPATAVAETPRNAPAAIELDRDDTPAGRSELGFDGGAPVVGWGVSTSLAWLAAPMTFTLPDGSTSEPIAHRQTVRLGGALALGPSVVAEARLPLSRQTGERLLALGDPRDLDRFVIGDLAVAARIRVAGTTRRAAFVRAELTLPTGDDHDFAGESSWTLAWRLIGRATLPADVVVAGSVGVRLRGDEVIVGDRLVSDELAYALGVVAPLPPLVPLWCPGQLFVTGELAGIVGNDVGSGAGPSPIEARVGILARPRATWAIAARVGRGLTDDLGSPALRATLELSVSP